MAVEVVLLLTLTSVCLGSTVITVTKKGDTNPRFWIKDGVEHGDIRIKLPSRNDPSLLIANTAVSDEGQYDYIVITNRGVVQDGTFRICVTAKYSPPSISTCPDEVVEGSPANFYCNASGGYPAGAIHWFDKTGTNWTKSATLEITEGEDRLLRLSSKLSFKSINSHWMPFRCVILNSKFIKEGESTFHDTADPDSPLTDSTVASAVAGVLVIGVIIAGLLIVLLYRRRRVQRKYQQQTENDIPAPQVPHRGK